jgi:RHS repeat-associated protein
VGITQSSYQFTDQELDTETGLYNYDARLYDPIVGQFVSADYIVPDWYDPQSLNRFAYARNNPVKYVDPSGHIAVLTVPGVVLALEKVVELVAIAGASYSTFKAYQAAVEKTEAGDIKNKTPSSNEEENKKNYNGGRHRETKKPANDGLDSHHMPSKDSYKNKKLHPNDGPSIQMEPSDHKKTGSYGRSKESQEFRGFEKELIDEVLWDDAIEYNIDDVQEKFGDKYNDAIEEMIDQLPDSFDDWN